ncbi:MAG: hypothetical protein AVDCRST_MAG22-3245 [uncultured Rubrobacteraceae bacterium]|uniref:Uncharacterized protein n=1 Tax=uncultured Rubrobacteraceae bacterium TaxID=349277 RepID=A0A6J4Q1W1_9ACTN|nr:MAG: hypothetical protein AVDCRST_MAG22-3245 [uncultured Rubrobacteraceae bacterium]
MHHRRLRRRHHRASPAVVGPGEGRRSPLGYEPERDVAEPARGVVSAGYSHLAMIRTDNRLEIRFSARLGEEPVIEVGLG